MTDNFEAIDNTERHLTDHESGLKTLLIRRTYNAAPEDVWDALTDPDRLVRWFLPITGDLRVGGRYSLEGNASGRIVRCDPPREIGLTWEMGGGSSDVTVLVQDSYLRWAQVDLATVRDTKSYLAKLVTRQALIALRTSARCSSCVRCSASATTRSPRGWGSPRRPYAKWRIAPASTCGRGAGGSYPSTPPGPRGSPSSS